MIAIYITIGVIIGTIIANVLRFEFSSFGVLRIDRTNPNKDKYKIEIDDLTILHKKKRVVLKIDPNADLSQE